MKTNWFHPIVLFRVVLDSHSNSGKAIDRHRLPKAASGVSSCGWLMAAAMLMTSAAYAQVTLTDIGATAPTPGPNDISQFSTVGNLATPPGLNFYWDNGANNPTTSGYIGETFTTLNNPQGYTLTSVAFQTAGLGAGGGNPYQSQSFTLNIYRLSGTGLTNATLLNTFTATSALQTDGDWMQWTGLGVSLAPGTNYAFTFGRSPGSPGDWEDLAVASGLPYSGGQVCEIINAGGKVKYSTSSNNYDMTFDLGLSLPSTPIANPPLETPSYANLGILAGTNVTLVATAAGSTPIYYQWQTDGGSGGVLTNIPGATSSNLVVNTTGFVPGTYQYDFVATNSFGASTSAVADITIASVFMVDIGTNTPTPGPLDIFQLSNTAQSDDGINYYTDNGANNNAWCGQTFTTGTNINGYVINSLKFKTAGNGSGFPAVKLYHLRVYALSDGDTNATLVANYSGYGGGTEDDWFDWVGLSVPLAPNSQYAYTIGRDATGGGWEHIADQGGNPYPGGQICTIPSAGGAVTFGASGSSDATFDINLSVSQAPYANVPTYTPNVTPIYAGTLVTLLETAVGTPPLSYQWLTDGGSGGALTNISGATGTNLLVDTTAFAAGNFNYAVIVTNAFGASTSSVQTLNIVAASAPQIVVDTTPTNLNEGYVGQTLTFSASFVGTLPITYQWMVDTGSGPKPIPAASNPSAVSNTLVLTNLQLANAGVYTLVTSNSIGGPVSSSPSTNIVFSDPPPPVSGSYAAMVLSENPVAYWRLNDTNDNPDNGVLPAYDASGHNLDGVYGMNVQNGYNGQPGPVPTAFPGFETNNWALVTANSFPDDYVTVPPLDLDTNTVTITMWINPSSSSQATFEGLFMNRNGSDGAGLGFGGTQNSLGMSELGYTWNTNNSSTWSFNSGLYPVAGVWSFVALVVQPTQATIYLYYIDPNTSQPVLYSAANTIAHGPEPFSGGTTWIGTDGTNGSRTFSGSIDEVAVFNKALSSDQLLALFSKGAGLAVTAASIAGEPQSAGVYAGATARFTATGINGSAPITYQWQYITATTTNNLTDGANISGSTTPSLTISNVTAANAGSYQLLVINPAGTTPSSVVTLIVATPVPGSYESAVLANNPLLYWKLDETNDPSVGGVLAYDFVSGLNGIYGTATLNGFNGILGPQPPQFPGFPTNNTAMETVSNTVNSWLTAADGTLATNNVTYVMWINPSGPVQNWAGLLMSRPGSGGSGFGFGGTTDATGMSELAYTWNNNSSATWSFDSLLFPTANQWSMVALVIQPTQATIYLFNTNGMQSAINPIPHTGDMFAEGWHLGNDAADNGNGGRTFPGIIDEVSVYLSALSGNQLQSLYNVGAGVTSPVTLTIAPAGAGKLTLTWSQGTLLQSTSATGPWTTNSAAVSPYTITPTNSQILFRVRVK